MGSPDYDLSRWPLVFIDTPADGATDAEMAAHLERVGSFYERQERFGMVVDVKRAPNPPPTQRKQLSDALAAHERRAPGLMACMAMVVSSEMQRGIITAISWVFPPPYPMKVFTDVDAATAWCRELLGQQPQSPSPPTSS